MSSDPQGGHVPWPIWALVTLLAAAIGGYATIYAARDREVPSQRQEIYPESSTDSIESLESGNSPATIQEELATRFGSEIKRTIVGAFTSAELAARKRSKAPLAEFFVGSGLDSISAIVDGQQDNGIRLESIDLEWDIQSVSISANPLRAEVRVAVDFRHTYRDLRGNIQQPVTGKQTTVFYLRKENEKWMIYALE